ncbi:MAG: STM4014 family protein [Peptococcaceae bacterium]|nr:STM4014 family protein [Peptococcaceae bacterium]
MSLILLGHPDTERTEYFLKAAHDLKESVTLIPLPSFRDSVDSRCDHRPVTETAKSENPYTPERQPYKLTFDFSRLKNQTVKIDPPPPASYPIDDLNTVMTCYHNFLREIQRVPGIKLLNSSDALWNTLDKFICKQRLQKGGLPTTPALADSDGSPAHITSLGQLRQAMDTKRIRQVFIKPRLGSGAAGVVAYRFNPITGAETMETSSVFSRDRLHNTNRLRKTGNPDDIAATVNRVLALDAIVEEWIPKSSFHGKAFDLRIVYQFGCLEFIVARQSAGAITNLHLNDNALAVTELALSPALLSEIEILCFQAVALFPGLNAAGLDILLHKQNNPNANTLAPMIIEINGQGDLIYQDIFAENRIYKSQIRRLTG